MLTDPAACGRPAWRGPPSVPPTCRDASTSETPSSSCTRHGRHDTVHIYHLGYATDTQQSDMAPT